MTQVCLYKKIICQYITSCYSTVMVLAARYVFICEINYLFLIVSYVLFFLPLLYGRVLSFCCRFPGFGVVLTPDLDKMIRTHEFRSESKRQMFTKHLSNSCSLGFNSNFRKIRVKSEY